MRERTDRVLVSVALNPGIPGTKVKPQVAFVATGPALPDLPELASTL